MCNMSKKKTPDEIKRHKSHAINVLGTYLDNLVDSPSEKDSGKADKLSYWIEDWVKFLDYEPRFVSKSLRKYKRGEIIKLHLGFNLGSEEGGLHYAVVLDKNNSIHNPVLTIIPLTSLKPTKSIDHLHPGEVFLGNELFVSMNAKLSAHTQFLQKSILALKRESDMIAALNIDPSADAYANLLDRVSALTAKIEESKQELELNERMKKEIQKMKTGSIALVSQITTISKIRIYDPKNNHDVLSGIKLSNEKLDLIDAKLQNLYIK